MQKNDLIELTIEDIGMDGAGIGRYHGMAVFVKEIGRASCRERV